MSGTATIIRKGELRDIPDLVQLWRRSVEATHRFLAAADVDMLEPGVRDGLAAMEVWVVEAESRLAGFMGMSDNMIEALFIDPAYMGKGLGSRLVEYARDLRGQDAALRVDVNEDNPDAHRFYLSRGFRQIGRSVTDQAGNPWPILHLVHSQF